jgi:hypothetical protein
MSLLMFLWCVIYVASLKSLGFAGILAYTIPVLFLFHTSVSNISLVLTMLLFTPGQAIGIPSIFVMTSALGIGVVLLKCGITPFLELARRNQLFKAVLLLAFIASFSLLWSDDVVIAGRYALEYLKGAVFVALLLVVTRTRQDWERLLISHAGFGALVLVIGASHHYYGTDTALHIIMQGMPAGTDEWLNKAKLAAGAESIRLIWPGAEPNYLGSQLVFPFGVAVSLFVSATTTSRRCYAMLCALLVLLGIAGTYSRGSLVALVVFCLLFVLSMPRKIPLLILFVVTTFCLATYFTDNSFVERLSTIPDQAVNERATGRYDRYGWAIELWGQSPVWGCGLGAMDVEKGDAAHNSFLQVLAELGIIGFFLYLFIIVIPVRVASLHVRRTRKTLNSSTGIILLIALLATCVNYCTISCYDPRILYLALSVIWLYATVPGYEMKNATERYTHEPRATSRKPT